jgi:hypothetical protein
MYRKASALDYLSELLSLLFPLCSIFVLSDRAQEQIDLGDDNLRQ